MHDTEQDSAYEDFVARRHRTKPCKYFQTGACWNTAEACKWAHVYYRNNGDPWQRPCKYYLEGFCARGQYCEFLHGDDPNRYLTPPEHQMNLRPPFLGTYPYLYPPTIPLHFQPLDYHHDSDNSYPSDNYPPSDLETTTTDDIVIETGSHFDSDNERGPPPAMQRTFVKPIAKKKNTNSRYKKPTDKNPRAVRPTPNAEEPTAPKRSRKRSNLKWRVISGGVIVGSVNATTNCREKKATDETHVNKAKEASVPPMPQRQIVPTLGLQMRRAKPADLKIFTPPVRPISAPPTATPKVRSCGASSVFAAEA